MDGVNVHSHMDKDFLKKLDMCRQRSGGPFVISSCFRTPEKNRSVGGSKNSFHLKGRAVDIICTQGKTRAIIVKAALSLGLTVGVMKTAIHIDDRPRQILFHYYK